MRKNARRRGIATLAAAILAAPAALSGPVPEPDAQLWSEADLSGNLAPDTTLIRGRTDNTLHSSGNPWRFRIRGKYRWATPSAGPVAYVYINDEALYQGSAGEWSRNRAQAGMDLTVGKRSDLLLYYQRQSDRLSTPSRINALGLTLLVDFD